MVSREVNLPSGNIATMIRRAYFFFGDEIDSDRGPLEITFQNGDVLLIDTKSDWSVRVENKPWVDPFEGNLTPENIKFIRTHGRWLACDKSDEEPYAIIIGSTLVDSSTSFNEVGELTALTLNFTVASIATESVSGELSVQIRERHHPSITTQNNSSR